MALRWKVCGITSEQDARVAVEVGADALGFVFYRPSPRCVDFDLAGRIAAELPRRTWRVGVFVDASPERMSRAVEQVGLDFLQLCGDEDPGICAALPRHAFKALRVETDADPDAVMAAAARYPECTLLIDAARPGMYGGTGHRAGWEAAREAAARYRLFLAGGLTADNVGAAVEAVDPWGVDVSSGVEASPGVKDHDKLRAFASSLEPYR